MENKLQWFTIINNKPILRPYLQTGTFTHIGGTWTSVFLPQLEDEEYVEALWNLEIKYMIKYYKNKYK